jgi:hypothetical protein
MKKLLLSIVACLVFPNIYADDLTAFLKMRDGSSLQMQLEASSEVKLQKNLLKVYNHWLQKTEFIFLIDDVASLSFSQPSTDIKNVSSETLCYRMDNGILYISGVTGNAPVQVYDASGVLLKDVAVRGSSCSISLMDFSQGLLLVKVNNQTIKILKR